MKRIFRIAVAALIAFSLILTECLCVSGTVITKGDLSVEEWIAAAESLNMDDYVSGTEEFLRALKNLKNAKYNYDNADNPEFSVISQLKSAWDNLKYEEKTAEPLFKGKTFSGETKVALNTWDYSSGETKYIVLSEYSRFTFTLSTTGTGEYGNSVDVFFVLKNGETSNRWWGGLWGSNAAPIDRTLDIEKTLEKAKMDPDSAISSLGLSLNNYGGESATFSDIYGYKQISAKYPENYESLSLAEWILAAKKLDLTKFTTGVEEFKIALENAELHQWLLSGGKTEEFKAYIALKEAWTNLKYSEKETESLVNETSGVPSQGTGFSAKLLKTVDLSEYEKFDIVMDVQKYKNPNGGLSLNLQFDNNGKILNQWFNANKTEDTRNKTSEDIISTGVNEWKIIKIYGANSGYNEEITLKAIYGYKYIHATLPEDADNMDLSKLLDAAIKFDTSKYTSGIEEFQEAITAAKILLGIVDPPPVELTEEEKVILALKEAWTNLKYSEKETESLVNETSGVPSQGTGFSAKLLKTVDLSEYEKFDIVMDVQKYKNPNGGLSLNLQFDNNGKVLNQWFNANKTEDTRNKTSEDIISTGVNEWKILKIYGANGGYNEEITLKAIYGYKFVPAILPDEAQNMNLSELVSLAKNLDISQYSVGTDEFIKAIAVADAFLKGTTVEELEAIEAIKMAWLNLKKSEKETESLVNETSGVPSQGTGFSATLLKTVDLSDYEKFDIVMDVQNYKNSGGGLSLNIQFANSGSTLNQWFNANKTEDSRTKTAEQIKSTGVNEWKTIKFFGANPGYASVITLKAIYGYKYVSPELPEGYEEFSLSDWIAAAEQLDTTGYLGADAFEETITKVKAYVPTVLQFKVLQTSVHGMVSYSNFDVLSGEVRNTAKVDYESRKDEAYKELLTALSNLKTAWKGLRTKEMYLIAIPKNAIKNTDEDEVPSEFGDYAVYENVGITSKFNYQLVDGKVDFVGIDRIEIYLRAATLKDGKYKTPETTSFLLQISSAENGRKEIWSAVPTGANYGKASFNTASQKNLQLYTEIGSDPVTIIDFMSGYNKKSSLVCDTLTLGGIYAIKYHAVPFPKGALLETSGADVSELSALVEHANKFNESDFSMATWKPFKKALAQAKAVIYDITAPQGTVDASKEKLLCAWGELIYYQRVPLYDVAENIEWGLEIADNLVYPQYVSVSDKTLPVGITSYAKLTNVPSKWHKLCFRQMTNSDTKNFDFIELYTRYDTTLNRGDSGCFYFQINYNYQVWKGFPSSNTNGKWQQLLIDLDEFTAQKDKTKKFVDASGKIGSFSVSLTGGASGNFDISSANLIKCIKVEAGKDPVTEEIGTSISVIGEDFNNDVFDLRYESADDGEEFELPKENTVSKPQEVKKENNITVIILISAVAAFVVFAAVTGIVIWRRKVK